MTSQKLGDDTVGGQHATHYRASIDYAKVADKLPDAAARRRDELAKLGTVPADVWIDDQDRVVKMHLDDRRRFAFGARGRHRRDDDGDHRLRCARRRAGAARRPDRRLLSSLERDVTPDRRRRRYRGPSWTRSNRAVGWGVLHLFYRVDRARAEADPQAGKRIVDAVQSLVDDGHQALLFAVLGHKADLGVMALGPDLARLQAFQQELAGTPLDAGRLLRVAHRAVGVHHAPKTTSGRGSSPRRASPGPRPRRGSRRGASAWSTTTSSASTRSCR